MPSRFIAAKQVKLEDGEVVHRSAYNGRLRLEWQRGMEMIDHTARRDLSAGGMVFPREAGPVPPDCGTFWNLVDADSPSSVAYGAIDLLVGLPLRHELCPSEHHALVAAFVAPMVASGHPVQWNIHAPRQPAALHAHVLVSIRGITPDWRIVPISGSPYLPIVRGGNRRRSWFVPNWGRHWREAQESFFQSRAIPLRVPAATRVPGWRPPSGPSYGEGLSGADRDDYRRERARHFEDDDNVIAAVMRDRFTFDRGDLAAILAVALPDLEPLRLQERVGSILGRVHALPTGARFTTNTALAQLVGFLRRLDIMSEAPFAAPPILDGVALARSDDPADEASEDWEVGSNEEALLAELPANRLSVLVGATRDALVNRADDVAAGGALITLLEACQRDQRTTILVPDLTARARLGKLADRRDVRCHALAGFLASKALPRVAARHGSRQDMLVLFDAQNTDDQALAKLVEVVAEGNEKLVLVIDESDIPRSGCGALARFAADRFADFTAQDPNGRGNYNKIGIAAAIRTASLPRIGFSLQTLTGRLRFDVATPTDNRLVGDHTSWSADPSSTSGLPAPPADRHAGAGFAAAATIITGTEADAGWRPIIRTPMQVEKRKAWSSDAGNTDNEVHATANDRAPQLGDSPAAVGGAALFLGRDGRPLQPGDLVVATRRIDPRAQNAPPEEGTGANRNTPTQAKTAARMKASSGTPSQEGTAAMSPIEIGARLRISHIDAARGLVTFDRGQAVFETLMFTEMPVPVAQADCLPLRYAIPGEAPASEDLLSEHPLPSFHNDEPAGQQMVVHVRSTDHVGELLDFAIRNKVARVVIAPDVARTRDELEQRLYGSAPEGALHAIVSALARHPVAPAADETPDVSTPLNPSRERADTKLSDADFASRVGETEGDATKRGKADPSAGKLGNSDVEHVGRDPSKDVSIAPTSWDANSNGVPATAAAPSAVAPAADLTRRTLPTGIDPVSSAGNVTLPSPSFPELGAPKVPSLDETSAAGDGQLRPSAPANAGRLDVEQSARTKSPPEKSFNDADEAETFNRVMAAIFSLPEESPGPIENMQPPNGIRSPGTSLTIQPPVISPCLADHALDREVKRGHDGDLGEEGEPGEGLDYHQDESQTEADGESSQAGAESEGRHDEDDQEEDTPSGFGF